MALFRRAMAALHVPESTACSFRIPGAVSPGDGDRPARAEEHRSRSSGLSLARFSGAHRVMDNQRPLIRGLGAVSALGKSGRLRKTGARIEGVDAAGSNFSRGLGKGANTKNNSHVLLRAPMNFGIPERMIAISKTCTSRTPPTAIICPLLSGNARVYGTLINEDRPV